MSTSTALTSWWFRRRSKGLCPTVLPWLVFMLAYYLKRSIGQVYIKHMNSVFYMHHFLCLFELFSWVDLSIRGSSIFMKDYGISPNINWCIDFLEHVSSVVKTENVQSHSFIMEAKNRGRTSAYLSYSRKFLSRKVKL